MDGIIFYTNFRPTRSRQPSKQFPSALPAIRALMQENGSDLTVEQFLQQLLDNNAVPTPSASCPSPTGSGFPNLPWPIIGAGGAALGAGGYLGYQAWLNRTPSWLSDENIAQFLQSQDVPLESVSSADAAVGVSEFGGADIAAALGEGEGLDELLLLAAL